jgi:hypothetical protein
MAATGFKLIDPYDVTYTVETCTADTAALYVNDPVKTTGAEDTKGRPVVTAAAAGDALRGVVIGLLKYTASDVLANGHLVKNHKPAGVTDMSVLVCTDDKAEYEVEVNGTLAAGAVGSNADMDTYAAGSTVTGISGCRLASSVGTGSAQFRIMRYAQRSDVTVAGANSTVVVRINELELKSTTGT